MIFVCPQIFVIYLENDGGVCREPSVRFLKKAFLLFKAFLLNAEQYAKGL